MKIKDMKQRLIIIVILLFILITRCTQKNEFPVLRGPYLGQKPPGMIPEIFAPGIISTASNEHGTITFTPDGREVFWSVLMDRKFFLYHMKEEKGCWSRPSIAPFTQAEESNGVPVISPDGRCIFFISSRPSPNTDAPEQSRRWVVGKTDQGWGNPHPMDSIFQKGYIGLISKTNAGNYYFMTYFPEHPGRCDIYRTKSIDGSFIEPVLLQEPINTDHDEMDFFIAPDESYLIFCSDRPGGYGSWDLYITFRDENGSWGEVRNMGHDINTEAIDRLAFVTLDKKYLFFMSNRNGNDDLYWMDAKIIEDLKPENLK